MYHDHDVMHTCTDNHIVRESGHDLNFSRMHYIVESPLRNPASAPGLCVNFLWLYEKTGRSRDNHPDMPRHKGRVGSTHTRKYTV